MASWWSPLQETASRWSEHKDARLAAALAYYSIFSLGPLIVIAGKRDGAGRDARIGKISRLVERPPLRPANYRMGGGRNSPRPCQGDCVLGVARYQLSGYVTFPIPNHRALESKAPVTWKTNLPIGVVPRR
jgi:hypothetical protein